nr:MAG TPA: hypothetical protein [Caudoviricetes sp.]
MHNTLTHSLADLPIELYVNVLYYILVRQRYKISYRKE